MKFLRTIILLLLCAVLPISGLAASGLASTRSSIAPAVTISGNCARSTTGS
ncbi:hypothetical protein [Burkholderia contaminans]|uniref:hypothetical protein n=1 Tax=Burkholderia contaminans TaxID=488447 RepID=UPI001CA8DF04|nr:hypothetical protein [Burkholderia contaminans]UAC75038.1 hypothetical protein K8B66_18625 [Burkholderia contaminans]